MEIDGTNARARGILDKAFGMNFLQAKEGVKQTV
jgi:hypothetical protein